MFLNHWLVRRVSSVELLQMETEWAVKLALKRLYCCFFVFAVYNGVATHSLQTNRRAGQERVVRVGMKRLCVCVCVWAVWFPLARHPVITSISLGSRAVCFVFARRCCLFFRQFLITVAVMMLNLMCLGSEPDSVEIPGVPSWNSSSYFYFSQEKSQIWGPEHAWKVQKILQTPTIKIE